MANCLISRKHKKIVIENTYQSTELEVKSEGSVYCIAAQNWTRKNEQSVLYASKSQLFDSSFRFRASLHGQTLPLAIEVYLILYLILIYFN